MLVGDPLPRICLMRMSDSYRGLMTERHRSYVNVYRAFPAGYQALKALEDACAASPLDPRIFELVKLRASQINGCAYCIDMHHKDARAAGETEDRLYMLPAWREAAVYSAPSGRRWR